MSGPRRTAVYGLWLVVLGCAGCQRGSSAAGGAPSSSAATSTTGSAPSSTKKPMTPEEEARFLGKKPEEMPLLLGPAPAAPGATGREQRLKELLSGQTPAERLPLVATESEGSYDPELYRSLTTEIDTRTKPK